MTDTEQRIRERAYQLWEQAGRPNDRGEDFWHAARREIEDAVPSPGAIHNPPAGASPEGPPPVADEPAPGIAPPKGPRAARAAGTPDMRRSASLDQTPAAGAKRGKPRPGKR
jgi:hypothetical protein